MTVVALLPPEAVCRALAPPRVEAWQPSGRYTATSPGSRFFGMAGVAGVATLIVACAFVGWKGHQSATLPQTLSVFDVAPPAAPPEPFREIPPGPQQVRKSKPRPRESKPVVAAPLVDLIPGSTAAAEPTPVRDPSDSPGPPIEDTTAPPTTPSPPAARRSDVAPSWQGRILAALNKVKRYPFSAATRRQQGIPYIRFVMDRAGHVLSSTLERACGIPALDREAIAIPKRADPLPQPPDDMSGSTFELVVPIEFFLD